MNMETSTIITSPLTIADRLHDDVLGKIFSFLLPDTLSLHSASLVCRTWALSTRRYVFESVTIRPSGIKTLVEILTDHPWPTLIPNVRRLEAHGTSNMSCRGGLFLDLISCHLTHLTLHDTSVGSFDLVVSMIHSMSQLQSIALLNITFPPIPSKKLQNAGLPMPPSVRRLQIRNTPVLPFLRWLSAHLDIPPLTHLDLGRLNDNELHIIDNVLSRVTSSLLYIVVAFGYDVMGHVCQGDKSALDARTAGLAGKFMPGSMTTTSNTVRFQQVFGIRHCAVLSLMHKLCVIHIEDFVGLFDTLSTSANAAEFLAARVLASVPGTYIKRVILGLEVSSAAQLCLYNINWPFFDDILTSDCYGSLETVEFRCAGQRNLDNIADYISTKLPVAASKNLLHFCKAAPNLANIHTI